MFGKALNLSSIKEYFIFFFIKEGITTILLVAFTCGLLCNKLTDKGLFFYKIW